MSEVLPTQSVNRWYTIWRSDRNTHVDAFAEKYFDSEVEAFHYWESRRGALGFDRVHRPLRSHENPDIWTVCIDPL